MSGTTEAVTHAPSATSNNVIDGRCSRISQASRPPKRIAKATRGASDNPPLASEPPYCCNSNELKPWLNEAAASAEPATQAKAADKLYDDVVDGYFARHKVKPGITGWAQINGWRGETDTREKIQRRVEHDLYYIENWSIWFDIYILIMTPISLIDTRSAY